MATRIDWQGKGYYKRERDYQGSAENGIRRVGHVWRKTWHGDVRAHQVTSERQLRRIEPRYQGGFDGRQTGHS